MTSGWDRLEATAPERYVPGILGIVDFKTAAGDSPRNESKGGSPLQSDGSGSGRAQPD